MKTVPFNLPIKSAGIILLFLLLCVPHNIHAQRGIEISLSAYPGYTAVNFEKALGYSDEYMNDWDQFYYAFSLKGLLTSDKSVHFGAEVGWQQLYYAYYVVPYVPSPVYREFNISTVSIMALARYSRNQRFFALTGAGIHIFYDGVAPAIFIEPGYVIKLGKNLKLPLSVRVNPVFGDGTPIAVSLGIGLIYKVR
jgi:hypothetical protein